MNIKKYSKFLCAGMSGLVLLFLAASVIFYHPDDPSFLYYSSISLNTHNQLGMLGAQSAAFLVYLLGGYGAFFFLFLGSIFIFSVCFSSRFMREWDRAIAGIVALCGFVGWCAFYKVDMLPTLVPGGLLGVSITAVFTHWFDPLGAQILLYSMLFSAAIILVRFPFLWCIYLVQQGISVARRIQQWLRPVYHVIFFVVLSVGRLFYGILVRLSRLMTDASYEQESLHVPQTDKYVFSDDTLSEKDEFIWQTFSSADEPIEHAEHSENIVSSKQEISEHTVTTIQKSVQFSGQQKEQHYTLPNKNIFIGVAQEQDDPRVQHELEQRARILEEKLKRFGVCGSVTAIKRGPVVTLFEYQPEIDSKISKIIALEDDLALALQALSIRIIAPIPGRSVVGFEVANMQRKNVLFSTLVQSKTFEQFDGGLPLILGEDTVGAPVFIDLVRMPHLLIAGSTGSGKSVALNAMLMSLLCTKKPEDLTLILIDPKRLEFAPYADVAHLAFPIVTEAKRAVPVLRWVVKKMEERYELMAQYGARNIFDYNAQKMHQDDTLPNSPLPFIVVVIDELSDLMMLAGKEAEELITRIAQMARAAGIHLIVATQRPSVDVITGLIKVNFPSRVSFRVTSKIDSRTILDCSGADKLLGRGDMLFLDSSASLLKRVHGAYVSDEEIAHVVSHIKSERTVVYEDIDELVTDKGDLFDTDDELYQEIINFLDTIDEISISLLQRRFRIGYNRSARIIDSLELEGLILPAEGGKMRKVVR